MDTLTRQSHDGQRTMQVPEVNYRSYYSTKLHLDALQPGHHQPPREGILYTEIVTYSSPLSKKKTTKTGYRRVSVRVCVNKI